MKNLFALVCLCIVVYSPVTHAGERDRQECPVGLVSGLTLDDEFGPGSQQVTRCIKVRDHIKVVFSLNTLCGNSNCTRAYGANNIQNALKDYEITHGISQSDYEVIAVVYGAGYPLILNNNAQTPHATTNPFQAEIQSLLDNGVKVQFCQNTARSRGVKLDQMIAGVTFVTAGVTSIADYQALGYSYIQP